MGKRATLFLMHVLMIGFSLVVALLSAGGFAASYVSPYESILTPVLGLLLPALLVMNIGLLFYWTLRWRYWAWIPLIAIALNVQVFVTTFKVTRPEARIPDGKTIKIAAYNIFRFRFAPYDQAATRIGTYLKEERVDIACFEEFKPHHIFTPDSIARVLDMPYVAVAHNKRSGEYDLAIFSRYPIANAVALTLDDSKYSTGVSMYADVDVDGTMVRIFSNHMQTTSLNQTRQFFEREYRAWNAKGGIKAIILITKVLNMNFKLRATQVQRVRQQIDDSPYPVIVCGDFNDTPASYTYRTIKGDLHDGFQTSGYGYGYTFRNLKKLLRIDYVFYSDDFKGLRYSSPSLPWSDHNPVIMELEIKNSTPETPALPAEESSGQ